MIAEEGFAFQENVEDFRRQLTYEVIDANRREMCDSLRGFVSDGVSLSQRLYLPMALCKTRNEVTTNNVGVYFLLTAIINLN